MTGVDAGRHAHLPVAGSCPRTRHRAPGSRAGWTGLTFWVDLSVPAGPAVLGLVTGGYRLGAPPLWRDEAATKAIASRSAGQILATMPQDDVVHCAYYLVMHVVIGIFGSSNGALRLPSVLAMSVACAFTALIARRLCRGPRLGAAGGPLAACTGMTAGLVFALLPAAIRYAQEARSYAIVTMMATVATYLLLRAIGEGGWRWWAGYSAAIFLAGLFNVFGLLLLVAHGLTLLATARHRPGWRRPGWRPLGWRRPGWRRPGRPLGAPLSWLGAGVAATTLTLPVVIMAYGQRDALSWISSSVPVRRDVIALIRLWAGSPGLVWPVFGLAALGAVASLIAGRRDLTAGTVALPWLVVPPAVLLAISATHPVYDQRYVEFCLPALAICAGSGITWLWRLLAAAALGHPGPAGPRSRPQPPAWRDRRVLARLAAVPAVVAAVALALALLPADSVVRQPGDRPDDLELEARIIAANAGPGDIVFYIPINDRIVSMPFPGPWRELRDIALARSPVSSDTLYGTDVTPAELLTRFTHVTRVWVVASADVDYLDSAQATPLDREEARLVNAMRERHAWRDGDTELTLYAAPSPRR